MNRKIFCLVLAVLMTLSLWGCGQSPEDPEIFEETFAETMPLESEDLSALGGWWAVTDEWGGRNGPAPVLGSFLLNPDTGEAECYDRYGEFVDVCRCILSGSALRMVGERYSETLDVDGDALLYEGIPFYRRTDEAPQAMERPLTDKDLSGKWFFGSDPDQWLEFYDDGTYSILNAEGETLENDTYEIGYLVPGYQDDIQNILLYGFDYGGFLMPDLGAHVFYIDKGNDGADCLIHEDSMYQAPRALQVVRASSRVYTTDVRDPDYPVTLRFSPFTVSPERFRIVDGAEEFYQSEWYGWDVTEDGILTLNMNDSGFREFSLDDTEEFIQLEPDGPVYYRVLNPASLG